MKTMMFGTIATAAMLISAPALAQTGAQTGVVSITGSVDPKCTVTNAGSPSGGNSFGGSVDLGKLDAANGQLKGSDVLTALFNAAGVSNLIYSIVCTTPRTSVNIDADPVVNSAATPSAGYANTVHYTATVTLTLADAAGNQPVTNSTESAPGGTSQTFDHRLAPTGNNVAISATNFHAPNSTDVMLAGTYSGKITITVTPEDAP